MRIPFTGLLLLLGSVVTPAVAGFSHADNIALCRQTRSLLRGEYRHQLFAVSPAVSDIMLAAMDGDTAAVRDGLARLPRDQRARWRQSAMSLAALDNRPDTLRALIADGADPAARAWVPPHTRGFQQRTLATMEHGPRPDMRRLVAAMQKAGMLRNQGRWVAPPVFQAAQCDQAAIIATLLAAGIPVRATSRPHDKGVDALLVAVINGNAAATRVLLEHGASPCLDDRRLTRRGRSQHRHRVMNVAGIGTRSGLPATLVARLQCRAR